MSESNIVDFIMSNSNKEGKASLMGNINSRSKDMYFITSAQIREIIKYIKALPPGDIRTQCKLSQRLVFHLMGYYRYCHMFDITVEELMTLLEYAPYGDLLDVIEKYGNFFRIHQLDSAQVSYISGVLLHDVSTEYHVKYHRDIIERLHDLTIEGLVDFCQKIHSNIISNLIYTNFLDTTKSHEEHMGNTTDSLMVDKLHDYYPFDVIYYVDENKKIYGIVRTEFEYVLEKKENPWTRTKIPTHILVEIQKRDSMCKIYNLGKCLPIVKTWNTILNPTLKCEDLLPKVFDMVTRADYANMPKFNSNSNPLYMLIKLAEFSGNVDIQMLRDSGEDHPKHVPIPISRSRRYRNVSPNITPVHSENSNVAFSVETDEDGNIINMSSVSATNPLYSFLSSMVSDD